MTGIAAGILFVLSSWLQKMMNEKHVENVQVPTENQ
jgi:POT family proton-dependent oligopeptide transporter